MMPRQFVRLFHFKSCVYREILYKLYCMQIKGIKVEWTQTFEHDCSLHGRRRCKGCLMRKLTLQMNSTSAYTVVNRKKEVAKSKS